MNALEISRAKDCIRDSLKMLDYCVLSDKSTQDDILRQEIQCKAQIDMLEHMGLHVDDFRHQMNKILS